jgi:hypothetical protein
MDKPTTEREPLSVDAVALLKQVKYIDGLIGMCELHRKDGEAMDFGIFFEDLCLAREAAKTLRAKITSGELMVVQTVVPTRTFVDGRWMEHHHCCGRNFSYLHQKGEFCLCGAHVVDEPRT